MSGCCGQDHGPFDGMSVGYRRRLWAVIVLNAALFVVEMTAGQLAGSQALKADALDFFADAVTYGLSLAVIGAAVRLRTAAAAAKGLSLFAMGLFVFGSTVWRVFVASTPEAPVMGAIGFLALLANLASVLLLMNYKDGDANVRSVWLCSRNDAIGNVIVMIAALGVWGTATAWPDLLVAGVMAGLFLTSSVQILSHALREWRAGAASRTQFRVEVSTRVDGCQSPVSGSGKASCSGGHQRLRAHSAP
ncbi:cation transporter [Rhizobium halophytocola]|uniref:Co/Zn/Cd efflux system component n=1 Tax=Rhizobium halophytocola TaxID=735519 RepID=A0ABS4DWU3_9HYPH|nr:cation transporter [Rhizobium halophytocola]MBP1850164.1 Co/Zn/Cd efflux system component [Rhizobium halophytocola]